MIQVLDFAISIGFLSFIAIISVSKPPANVPTEERKGTQG